MTTVFIAGPIQGQSAVSKRRSHQFLHEQRVVAEVARRSTTAAVIAGGPTTPLVLFVTHSSELLHYAPSFCKWTTCRLPAKRDLEFKLGQTDARQEALRKRTCGRPGSSVALQALQIRRLRTVRSPATTEFTHSLHRRLRVEPTACGPMAVVQLVRREHVRHHARNMGHRPATFVSTFGLLSCSLDACFDDRCWPVDRFLPSEAVFLCTIQEATAELAINFKSNSSKSRRRSCTPDCCGLRAAYPRSTIWSSRYANLTLAQWRCVSGPADDQGLHWQCKRCRCGGCTPYEALQKQSLRTAYVVNCKSNILLAGRWLLSNLLVASMSGITLGIWDTDRPPLSPRSVSSAVAWTPTSTIGFDRLTASVLARQCSPTSSKWSRTHSQTRRAR
ncbi:hypothetical protein HPB50_017242 [Hyalomma asiaticum]|uniref:Uncharacterized protein n=1 Tax=Hyalomma asiaticum TaxID=266040 RepID=A0ACB7TJD6_HYAAI|nr:hypothetical protein HPB50_017242 [Hyalomma asiaticum]